MANEPMPSREAAESQAAAWIARRDTAEWDAAAFELWLAESVSHRVAYYRLHAAWVEAGRLRALSPASPIAATPGEESTVIEHRQTIPVTAIVTDASDNRRLAAEPSHPSRRKPWALAAGLAALLIAAAVIWQVEQPAPHRFATVVGGLQAVPLADGSRVTLNTDSELQVSLEKKERVVSLDRGEAYFEVAKDPTRPFIVNVGRKRVIAVGTQFSVRRDGDEVSVAVTEGTVRMEDRRTRSAGAPAQTQGLSSAAPGTEATPPGSAEVVLLPAGSVARAQADAVLVQKEPVADIEQHLSWRSGQLTFRDTPLSDAVAEFNRYNEKKIVIEDPSIAALQLGGIFRSTDIDPFIALLEQGFPVRAREEGNRILLTHN